MATWEDFQAALEPNNPDVRGALGPAAVKGTTSSSRGNTRNNWTQKSQYEQFLSELWEEIKNTGGYYNDVHL